MKLNEKNSQIFLITLFDVTFIDVPPFTKVKENLIFFLILFIFQFNLKIVIFLHGWFELLNLFPIYLSSLMFLIHGCNL
jgi:hypothetical protein